MDPDANPPFEVPDAGGNLGDVGASIGTSFDAPALAGPAAMAPRERHRVFVKSGVTGEVSEDTLQRHFSHYGNVTDVYIPRVMPSQIPKGFAYISFDSDDAVHRAVITYLRRLAHFPFNPKILNMLIQPST